MQRNNLSKDEHRNVEEFDHYRLDYFTALFKGYYPSLCNFAERILGDPIAAEEITDDLFLRLWARQSEFDNPASLKAFLYTCSKNACYNHLKKQKRIANEKNKLDYFLKGSSTDFVLNEIIRAETIREIYAGLENLPAECKKIMRLSFVEGLDNKKIASNLHLSIHTVKNQKSRGLSLLRKMLIRNLLLFSIL
jgi:RNA polymerase sigma-70 factor (family 1)